MAWLHKNTTYFAEIEKTADEVRDEIDAGLELLSSVKKPIVSFLGSHVVEPGHDYYDHAKKLASLLGERGFAISSGGGPGIMHAANAGAKEAGAPSLGIVGALIKSEEVDESVFTKKIDLKFIFVRRFILSIKSVALIFYPGGFGTMNELFEYLTLMQINISDRVPIIMVGREYWKGLADWLTEESVRRGFVGDSGMELMEFIDEPEEILKAIERSPHPDTPHT